ncbi:MAG TPA: GGDEF domain-containing protein [Trebonia sp.]|nr:GGDEF domain-containing protein [Trebonia sp.]
MAETALNEAGQHGYLAVPLASQQPSASRGSTTRTTWPIPIPVPPEAQLARMWLAALTVSGEETTGADGDVPMDSRSSRHFLTRQSAVLVSILLGSPFRPRQAATVGHALVKADFVGADVLGRSLRVLILRLPELLAAAVQADPAHVATASDLDQRVASVTEALANGYVRALRDRTLAEQESIRRTELDAQRIISEQFRHQALHDPLTGLPNRAAAFDRLAVALATAGGARIGLCYLDLDGFKAVNDRYGHDAGDELLVAVAERIGRVARDQDALAARIGGDEFIVLAEPSPGERGMVALAAGILAEVRRPVALRIGWVGISACAGVVECTAGSPAAATMVADADTALYQAKSQGPGRWAVFGSARRQAR